MEGAALTQSKAPQGEDFEHRLDNLLAVGALGGRLGFTTSKALPPIRLIHCMEICICAKGGRNILHYTAFWMLAKLGTKKKVNGLFLCLFQKKRDISFLM